MKVAILGAGVVGLCCAIELLRCGHDVSVYTREETPDTTSDCAGAIWLPLLNHDERASPPDYEQRLAAWTHRSWLRLQQLLGEPAGVRLIRNHELFREAEEPPAFLTELWHDLRVDADDRLPNGFAFRWTFTTIMMETPLYMRWLAQSALRMGASVARRSFEGVDELAELPDDVVVNCSGLGARELFGDTSMRGVKGQLLLHDPIPLDEALGAYDFGVLPRSDALVLGSLFLEEEGPEPMGRNTEAIWAEISRWCRVADGAVGLPPAALDRARVRRVLAGVRPFRAQGVRVEVERAGDVTVVHNYGHGASGFTLSWGCAEAVVAQVTAL